MFLQEDGHSFFENNSIKNGTIIFGNANIINEATLFARDITDEENDIIKDVLLQFVSDYYEHLKTKGLNKFVTKTKTGYNAGPIHIKSAEEIILKNYNKIRGCRRGKYDLMLYECNINNERTAKELYEVSWEFCKSYNASLPDVNIRILPVYNERKVTDDSTINGKATGKTTSFTTLPFTPKSIWKRITKGNVRKANTNEIDLGYEKAHSEEFMSYEFYIKIESDTFKIR